MDAACHIKVLLMFCAQMNDTYKDLMTVITNAV